MDYNESFKIGYITKTRGLKGEIQLFFEFKDPDLLDLDLIFIEINRQLVPFFVSSYKLQSNNTGYFFLEDIDHIDKAQELLRKSVFLPNTKMPEREEGEFLIEDLKGFNVFDSNYGELGVILEINEYPQQFVATVSYQSQEVLFPLSDDFIEEIDEEKKELHINLPDGLLDVYLNQS
ncbi:ribosome maturation factor RimM [Albibacterium bauzanense]|uniref:Ribosome maturation factor RimM n=1 Tax=Albibacterium bauzanense TaxID=653929 RepID=A0A4R1LW33_9SPHI|nr:ribosome maturation factor RimM [Albibacterium bauzanense]TCK82987.1 16S rRNA processing protein RimM [Albibacterium bauzanense]